LIDWRGFFSKSLLILLLVLLLFILSRALEGGFYLKLLLLLLLLVLLLFILSRALEGSPSSFIHLEPCCMCRETLLCGHGMACFVCKQRREMFAFFGILSLNLPIPLFVE